jgi:quinohemoprotein ethanol dehydrogenase
VNKILAPLCLALAVSTPVFAQSATKVDDAALRNAAKNPAEWLSYGFTQGETRFSPLNRISATNVGRLALAWSYDIGQGGGGQEATPLEWNNTLFGITNWSIVYAVDARTGQQKWRWDPEVNRDALRPKICCGAVSRGLAIYDGLIIAPILDGRLQALDAATGKPVWEARVSYTQDGYTLTMAPRIAHGKVVVGVAGAEYPVRGYIQAFDARTGRPAWRFYTVPGDPSKPFENPALEKAAETWGPGFWKLGGGGSVWDGMAYDPDANLLYVGTGNGGPWPEELRHSQGKDNLYVCSILAINPDTGDLKWYFQNVPGDSWDYDSVQQLLLADLTVGGRPRKVLMQANKNGFYYVLDRVTGEFLSGKPFAPVNWASGLDEKTGRPFVNEGARYGEDVVQVTPAVNGAHNWAPMSFHPATGLVYIPTTSASSYNFAVDRNFQVQEGRMSNTGIRRRPPTADGPPGQLPATAPPLPMTGPDPIPGERSVLIAWDPVTQKQRWAAAGGGASGGGTLATAGNLVFQVLPDGRLLAYSADKGEKLLEIQTGLRAGMGPPMTFEIDGKQFITVTGGVGLVVARNAEPGAPPPVPTASTVYPRMVTFALPSE